MYNVCMYVCVFFRNIFYGAEVGGRKVISIILRPQNPTKFLKSLPFALIFLLLFPFKQHTALVAMFFILFLERDHQKKKGARGARGHQITVNIYEKYYSIETRRKRPPAERRLHTADIPTFDANRDIGSIGERGASSERAGLRFLQWERARAAIIEEREGWLPKEGALSYSCS